MAIMQLLSPIKILVLFHSDLYVEISDCANFPFPEGGGTMSLVFIQVGQKLVCSCLYGK